jgi:hypothetical protein
MLAAGPPAERAAAAQRTARHCLRRTPKARRPAEAAPPRRTSSSAPRLGSVLGSALARTRRPRLCCNRRGGARRGGRCGRVQAACSSGPARLRKRARFVRRRERAFCAPHIAAAPLTMARGCTRPPLKAAADRAGRACGKGVVGAQRSTSSSAWAARTRGPGTAPGPCTCSGTSSEAYPLLLLLSLRSRDEERRTMAGLVGRQHRSN